MDSSHASHTIRVKAVLLLQLVVVVVVVGWQTSKPNCTLEAAHYNKAPGNKHKRLNVSISRPVIYGVNYKRGGGANEQARGSPLIELSCVQRVRWTRALAVARPQ